MKITLTKPEVQKLIVNGNPALGWWGPTYEFKEIFKARGYAFKEFPISEKWFAKFSIVGMGRVVMKGWVKVFTNQEDIPVEIENLKAILPEAQKPIYFNF